LGARAGGAQAGCSSKVIASISGQKCLRQVERYVEAAEQAHPVASSRNHCRHALARQAHTRRGNPIIHGHA